MPKRFLEKTFAIVFILVGLGLSTPFVASKISLPSKRALEQLSKKDRNIASQRSVSWFKELVVEAPNLDKEYKYEIINDQKTLTGPWVEDEKGAIREGRGNVKILDVTKIDRQFTCHKIEIDRCVFEHVGINFEDFGSFRQEAEIDGEFEFTLFSKMHTSATRNSVQKSIPKSYFKDFAQEIEAYHLLATQ